MDPQCVTQGMPANHMPPDVPGTERGALSQEPAALAPMVTLRLVGPDSYKAGLVGVGGRRGLVSCLDIFPP